MAHQYIQSNIWRSLRYGVFVHDAIGGDYAGQMEASESEDFPVRGQRRADSGVCEMNTKFYKHLIYLSSILLSTFDTQTPQMEIFSKMKLEQSLKELRITADIVEIQEWSRDTDFSRHARTLKQFTAQADNVVLEDDDEVGEETLNRSLLYMQRANQIIRERSDQTALSFIYLAAPPKLSAPDFAQRSASYMELLTELTADLPPTILVHGVSTVTSTTL